MAIAMPLATGVCATIALWLLLGGDAGASPTGGADGRASLRDGLRVLAEAVGAVLPTGVVDNHLASSVAQEVVRALVPFIGTATVTRTTAMGLFALATAAAALLGGVVSLSPLGLLVGAVGFPTLFLVRAQRSARQRAAQLAEAMPESFHALAISLGSGHSLGQALRFVGNHAPEPIHTEFMRASFAMTCGLSATEALDALLARLPAPGLDLVALALKVSQRTGAPLKDLLAQAAGMVGERVELARRLEVKTAQARLSARLVTVLPLVLIAVLALLSEDFRAGVGTPTGAVSVLVALVLDAVAWVWIRRVMEVDT